MPGRENPHVGERPEELDAEITLTEGVHDPVARDDSGGDQAPSDGVALASPDPDEAHHESHEDRDRERVGRAAVLKCDCAREQLLEEQVHIREHGQGSEADQSCRQRRRGVILVARAARDDRSDRNMAEYGHLLAVL